MHTRCSFQSAVQLLAALACALLIVAMPLPAQSPTQQAAPQAKSPAAPAAFHQEVIADLPSGSELVVWRAEANHVAWVEKKGKNCAVKLDGKSEGATYEEVNHLYFNDEGTHLVFFGKHSGRWFLVMDGQEDSTAYTWVTTVAFQPHGNSFAFSACTDKKNCHLVVDRKEAGPQYDELSFPRYSDDGKRLGYFGKHDKKWFAVVDGKETGGELELVDFVDWGFSKHANRFYAAVSPSHWKWTYIVDDLLVAPFDTISPIAFSQDDKHYAYGGVAAQGGFKKQKVHGTIVLDGQLGTPYDGNGMSGSWTMLLGANQEIMSGGERDLDPNFHGISNPRFNFEGKLVYAARESKGDVFVTDGQRDGPPFDDVVSGIVFTDDARHFAYIGRRGGDFVEVRDNQPGKTFSIDARIGGAERIQFSDDNNHLAYELVRGGTYFDVGTTRRARRTLVMDGQQGKEYNAFGISFVQFSKDARHFSYLVGGADGKRDLVVVDGQESPLFDDLNLPRFSDDGKSASFVARDSSRLLRVTFPFQ